MWESIQAFEPAIRLSAFLGIFVAMALWEYMSPRRERRFSRLRRWSSNLGLVVFNTVVLRFMFPFAAVAMALTADANGWGLFNAVPAPLWLAVVLSVVMMDFAIYLQHVVVHAVPVLWRIHRMHHADLDIDVTTGLRFHPLEIVFSMAFKLVVVSALGAPALAVLIFEVILNGASMFNHANVRLPQGLDRWLRLIIVTPDMHRVHHSIAVDETNSNFGFNLPWWDRLFGTYAAQPGNGHTNMTIGIEQFRQARDLRLDQMLIQPFLGATGDYPRSSPTLIRMLLLAVIIAVIAFAVIYRDALDAETLFGAIASFGIWAPLVFMVMFAVGTVAFLPGMMFSLAGGVMFGPVLGTVYNLTGATIGAVLAFMAARYVASNWVRRKTGPRLDRIIQGVEDEGWRFVAFTRLVPLFPFNLLNYALGLTRIPLSQYTLATAICMIPGATAFTYLGYAGREIAAGSESAIRNGLIGIALLAVAVFLPRLVKRLRGAKHRLSARDLKQRLDGSEDIFVLDVRDTTDYAGAGGHIPGAKNIPLADVNNRLKELDPWRQYPLAVVCQTNKKSKKAVDLLRAKGFDRVLLVDDGMVGWSANGFKTE